ncbi:MAG: two-component sensor histidine kinase [Alteromonadaceae bacterium]|nr:MAG: two-component sensor histidine kinase [Alteromonadaceae bacterium]
MIKSIRIKLWLTFFFALILGLGALLILTHLSVKKRFLDYATDQILERLEPLELAVRSAYLESESLSPFIENPSHWAKLRDATYRQYLQHQNRPSSLLGPKQQDWTERQTLDKELQTNQRAFFQHLILTDENKNLIAGRIDEDANYIYRAIQTEDQVIAYIAYVKPKAFLRAVDRLFVDQQIRSFAIICIVMIFTSLIIALLVSRWIITPLTLLSKNAKKLAEGDFSVRIETKANDELGQLCNNFDEMARTLEKNEQARKCWVADISHEMRTPLAVLKAQLEAMEDGIRKPSIKNINLLQKNVEGLNHILNDLYELSLADLGALTYRKELCNIQELVSDIVASNSDRFREKGLELHFVCRSKEKDVFMMADSTRIKQLMNNLIENSYRYTDSPGQIEVHLDSNDSALIIAVHDSAPGVSGESIDKIFERLYRVESSRNRNTGGAGLGLSICEKIVESHQGEITAKHATLGGLALTIEFKRRGL